MPALAETLFDAELARILHPADNAQARERLVEALALLIAGDVDLENEFPLPLPESNEVVQTRLMNTVAMLSRAVWDAQRACADNGRLLEAEMARCVVAASDLH